ncbi:protein translocase subunit SecF [Sanguibacter sp. HDW7]|uniref:protein translocase subunit SecF n=1 Tax=Sanguibacter sp. HDW7 TaxID=2714931 RepID=UPI00140E2791|nr:protein translocase subunit SecF [Sanguibacter sp. HDW7]QIK83602.1 protein translocase subunit SecF [Sanguibacter sp. HDW7]
MARSGFSQWGNDLHTGRRSYNIVGRRKGFFAASLVIVVLCALVLGIRGFNFGIEFTGGSEFTISGISDRSQSLATDTVAEAGVLEAPRVSSLGSSAMRVQTVPLEQEQIDAIKAGLAKAFEVPDSSVTVTTIGATWGKDVSSKTIQGLIVFVLLVTVVMTAYFRNWRMAAGAIIALFHDLILTLGVYALVGWEVTPATMIGFLTILGYSIYDTVVVFDKVRENTDGILAQKRSTYEEQANLAVNQTLVRSINTSVVALLPVSSILFIGAFVLGAGTLRDIALALFVGMAAGTYSSIFLATPLEVALRDREPAIKAHTEKVLALRAGSGEGEELSAYAVAGKLLPGQHQGHSAQPKRRKK